MTVDNVRSAIHQILADLRIRGVKGLRLVRLDVSDKRMIDHHIFIAKSDDIASQAIEVPIAPPYSGRLLFVRGTLSSEVSVLFTIYDRKTYSDNFYNMPLLRSLFQNGSIRFYNTFRVRPGSDEYEKNLNALAHVLSLIVDPSLFRSSTRIKYLEDAITRVAGRSTNQALPSVFIRYDPRGSRLGPKSLLSLRLNLTNSLIKPSYYFKNVGTWTLRLIGIVLNEFDLWYSIDQDNDLVEIRLDKNLEREAHNFVQYALCMERSLNTTSVYNIEAFFKRYSFGEEAVRRFSFSVENTTSINIWAPGVRPIRVGSVELKSSGLVFEFGFLKTTSLCHDPEEMIRKDIETQVKDGEETELSFDVLQDDQGVILVKGVARPKKITLTPSRCSDTLSYMERTLLVPASKVFDILDAFYKQEKLRLIGGRDR